MTDKERAVRREHAIGLLYALGAFGTWGLVFPIYLKALKGVPVIEILAHRIVWAAVFAAMLVIAFGRLAELRRVLTRHNLAFLLLSALLVTVNWSVYIIAVAANHIVATSLGYFINPLVNVALGMLVLGERLRRLQMAACVVAAIGVAILIVASGEVPWIALSLAFSFGFYGFVRKIIAVEALVGFTVEAAFLTPFAAGYLLWLAAQGGGALGHATPLIDALLLGAGIVTALPLIWFAAAARKLPLSTLGLVQYSSPSASFILGVFVYGEPFTAIDAVTFSCIWLALALYSVDAMLVQRRAAALAAARGVH